jgi:Protein of unknown function (DUF2637)
VASKPNPEPGWSERAGRYAALAVHRFLWLAVLTPVLAVSAYSLFWVGRHLGMPPWIAVAVSTCFDGVALTAANYSLRYAEERMGGSFPRAVVRIFAGVGAYVQTLHATLAHEPAGSWVLWASLPFSAVIVYEIHLRWARRKALAAAGFLFPEPLPSFGVVTWVLFPFATLRVTRTIVEARRTAVADAMERAKENQRKTIRITAEPLSSGPPPKEMPPPPERPALRPVPTPNSKRRLRVNAHTPKIHIRAWAAANGHEVKPVGPLKPEVIADHDKRCEECAS